MAHFNFDFELTPEAQKYFADLEKLMDLEAHVGFQASSGSYEDGETTVVEVAAYNEFGTSGMPARPFMKQTMEVRREKLVQSLANAIRMVEGGSSAEQAIDMVGAVAKGEMQLEIAEGEFAPNAESTVKKKGSSRPLIDTGLMRQSVEYKIVNGGE